MTRLMAEALNTAGGLDLMEERFYGRARPVPRGRGACRRSRSHRADRAEPGDGRQLPGRLRRGARPVPQSLAGFEAAGNVHGCAVAYHNLGVASNDLSPLGRAERYLRLCLQLLRETGDLHLRGLAAMNHAHALAGLGRLREARVAAETATGSSTNCTRPRELADAYWVLGAVSGGRVSWRPRRRGSGWRSRSPPRPAVRSGRGRGDAGAGARSGGLGRQPEAFAPMARAAARARAAQAGRRRRLLAAVGTFSAGVRAWGELLAVLHPGAAARAARVAAGAVARARELGSPEAMRFWRASGSCGTR